MAVISFSCRLPTADCPLSEVRMQNRFGLKDLISIALVVLLIAVVVLGMKQLDRQWDMLRGLQDQGKEQTRLLASISRTLDDMASNGVAVSRAGATTQSAGGSGGAGGTAAPEAYF